LKITLFSSNQPRHISLARQLADIANEVFFVSEVTTVFPGKVADFYNQSDVMQAYFENVNAAEERIIGDLRFLPSNVRSLSIKRGDLNGLSRSQLSDALQSDLYVVFGASYIKGWLIDFLVSNQAVNIHLGISPYYRGASCNFWALYDDKPSYVGATIHMLAKGLDSGDMLFHCLPKPMQGESLFDFTMRSVSTAHHCICQAIENKSLLKMERVRQNRALEVRHSRVSDFTDQVAQEFLERKTIISPNISYPDLLNPVFY
jgi:folate-dependent phosphoribosylglycinamide formyltransferase PurN